jgi:ferredoxin
MSEHLITVEVVDRDECVHKLQAPTDMGLSLMEVCKMYELPVKGTCGGMALCASCHVYVLSKHELPPPSEDEQAMLDSAFFVRANSRLSCQIRLRDELDGLQVQLAPESE